MEAFNVDRRFVTLTALILAAMFLVPPAAAQTPTEKYDSKSGDPMIMEDGARCFDAKGESDDYSCVVLYGHTFDLLNILYINVQRPPEYLPDLSRGFTATPGYEPLGWNFNELTLASSPGFVEYKGPGEDPRLHPERGITSDVTMADADIWGYWYLSADFDEITTAGIDTIGDNDPSIGIMPCLTVRMVLETGRHPGQGTTLAEGTTTKTIVTGAPLDGTEDPGVPEHPCPDGNGPAYVDIDDVIEFEVNLGSARDIIPASEGFVVHVEWWNHAPGHPSRQDKFYMHQWNLRTGGEYLPRLVVPVEEPVRVEEVVPKFFAGKLFVQGVLNSPWGSYDVDTGNIEVEVVDSDGNLVQTNNMKDPILRYSVDHDGHFKPVNATFEWDYQADGLEPGEYTVRMIVRNWQWTGMDVKEAKIRVASDISKSQAEDSSGKTTTGDPTANVDTEEGPGVALTLVVAMTLALLGAVRLRRRF